MEILGQKVNVKNSFVLKRWAIDSCVGGSRRFWIESGAGELFGMISHMDAGSSVSERPYTSTSSMGQGDLPRFDHLVHPFRSGLEPASLLGFAPALASACTLKVRGQIDLRGQNPDGIDKLSGQGRDVVGVLCRIADGEGEFAIQDVLLLGVKAAQGATVAALFTDDGGRNTFGIF